MPDYTQASNQAVLQAQKILGRVERVENLDSVLDSMFMQRGGPDEEIGLQQFRIEFQTEVGGNFGPYNPDGGSYIPVSGPEYVQGVLYPVTMQLGLGATELAQRISKAGKDVTVVPWVSKMIADVKVKMGNKRNQNLQGYNTGQLATVDATYSSGTTVQLAATPFGARLIDKGDQVQFTDASFNQLGTAVQVLDVTKNGIGVVDTITVSAVPGGLAAGNLVTLPYLSNVTPLFLQGLTYMVSPLNSAALDYLGIPRSNSLAQAPAMNANNAPLTLGIVYGGLCRLVQALGVERFKKERKKNRWYGHIAQVAAAQSLGYAKQFVAMPDGKAPYFDGVPSPFAEDMLAGAMFDTDSVAATNALYFLDTSTLCKVRFPGANKFIPGPIDGMWFEGRDSQGSPTSERLAYFQDAVNYAVINPWANLTITNLQVPQVFSN